VSIENDTLRVTVLEEGGHIAEVLHKPSGVNPLWIPHWESVEPSQFDPALHGEFGDGADAKLLAGIMGHNLCLDIFGGPSPEEATAGLTAHGEASVARYKFDLRAGEATMQTELPMARLRVTRALALRDDTVRLRETVENLSSCDRPIGWTEHVTLAPPFLQHGKTEFRSTATRSKVFESEFGAADYLTPGAIFNWPQAPRIDDGVADLRLYTKAASSSAYTAHLMDPAETFAFFVAFTPEFQLALGYVWTQAAFPWMGIWEENRSRKQSPWTGRTVTRGMEFGVSPFPETRRQMIDRGSLFGVPTYRWIPAHARVEVEYWIVARRAAAVPERLVWPANRWWTHPCHDWSRSGVKRGHRVNSTHTPMAITFKSSSFRASLLAHPLDAVSLPLPGRAGPCLSLCRAPAVCVLRRLRSGYESDVIDSSLCDVDRIAPCRGAIRCRSAAVRLPADRPRRHGVGPRVAHDRKRRGCV
jgi:hypothetical protein